MNLISSHTLNLLCPKLNPGRAELISGYINIICPGYGINTADILHEFLANLIHESGQFTRYEEGLNYSSDSLIKTFGRHRISIEDANRYGRSGSHSANQKEIANRIYGGSWGKTNLGNIEEDDGFNFRGCGPIQMTGRANITKFGDYMFKTFNIKKSPEEWAKILRTSDEFGIHSACWLFAISKQLIDEAVNDDMKAIVKKINGGYIGMDERTKIYEQCKKLVA